MAESGDASTGVSAQTEGVEIEADDFDRDSLHTLPLSFIPLETPGLKSARLIKNARLESVVELFRGRETGSGQIQVEAVSEAFGWAEGSAHNDYKILSKLERLPSYDVYSLRVSLRKLDIKVDSHKHLKLTQSKMDELTGYMRSFTQPLIIHIYGDRDVDIKSHEDLINLFRNADVKDAREKLKLMATTLGIELDAVPKFLEDYGDVFLSLSYYRQCLDDIQPLIDQFLGAIDEIRENWVLKENKSLLAACDELEQNVSRMISAIMARFDSFDDRTKNLWEDISAERFHQVERLIKSYHVTIGGTLCALTVKMAAWTEWFPSEHAGSPMKRAEFIMSEMRQGMDRITELTAAAEGAEGGLRFERK